jgi:SAM-dependent methyltransferase
VDDFRAASLQAWSTVAPDWAQLTTWVDVQLGLAADWMIAAAALKPGERVLELAGGPGSLSSHAARAVGSEGRVICTDFAEPMVQASRSRLAAEGLSVECRVMDAEAIDLPDASVDAVLCRMGYMLMADPAQAMRETARVLVPGGRLALAVWADASANPWAALPMRAIMTHVGAPPPPADAPGMWALCDEDRVHGLLVDAGLQPQRIAQLDGEVAYDSLDHWFELTSRLAGPVRGLLASMDTQSRAEIKRKVQDAASPYEQPGGSYLMPERMLAAIAGR